jgi:23S rRNA (adenine2503-C2)-methyltransferase
MKINFKEASEDKILGIVLNIGHKPYRAKQISKWVYENMVSSIDEMTNLSIELREQLKKRAFISNLCIKKIQVSKDCTIKFLFELEDGETIESVLIPNNSGAHCFTICISSQVGCAMGCSFCITGKMGLKRNLKAYEIYDQVLSVKKHITTESDFTSPSITNIVFMGMGEPFMNFDEVNKALWTLVGPMGFSKRKITVSTCGVIPGFKKLAEHGPGVNLAVSLNATTDETRTLIMPVNKKHSIKKLINACKEYPLQPYRRITFEYVMLRGINDTNEDAYRLVRLIGGIKSKVNLIPYNTSTVVPVHPDKSHISLKMDKPLERQVLVFKEILHKAGIAVIVRKSKGADISAACGQLKGLSHQMQQ